MLKVLQVHNRYQHFGGEDIVVSAEQELLRRHGHNVLIFEACNHDVRGLRAKVKAALTVSYSTSSKGSLTKVLKKNQPDVVHVHNFFPLLTPSIYDACRKIGIPVVQTLHNYRTMCPGALLMRDGNICEDCITGSAYQAVLHGCYRDSRVGSLVVARMVEVHRKRRTWQEKVDRFITLTEFSKKKFAQAGFPVKKIAVKPNFTVGGVRVTESSSLYEPFALFVGRLSKEKGIDTLLKAWEKLSLPLLLAGDGPLLDKAQSIGLRSVECLGHMSSQNVSAKMSQASFLIMPSEWYEGFPMVLVEAFAHGLPVIASRLGGMAEIVEDGRTGLHFEAGNALDLAKKVRWMQSNPEACKQMGENARQVYLEKYTPEMNYKMLIQIYREATGGHV